MELNEKSMTETKDASDKTIRGEARKPLSLQRTVESGHVRQNFSHGRSKSVVVEKRRSRKLAAPGATPEAELEPKEAKPAATDALIAGRATHSQEWQTAAYPTTAP